MSTQTLAEAGKLVQNKLVAAIAAEIVKTNEIWSFIPWNSFTGQSVTVNAEETLGDAQHAAVGDTITATAASTFNQKTFFPTTTIGDALVNNLVQATSASAGKDQMAIEVMKKSKRVSHMMQEAFATADGLAPNPNSLHTLCHESQYTAASEGQALSFKLLDEVGKKVKAKPKPDFYLMSSNTLIAYRELCRSAFNGNTQTVVRESADGQTFTMDAYAGVPIFECEFLSETETANGAALTGGNLTSVYAGVFDDGTESEGIAIIYPEGVTAGIDALFVGEVENRDEKRTRIRVYWNIVCYNKLGLARATSIDLSL